MFFSINRFSRATKDIAFGTGSKAAVGRVPSSMLMKGQRHKEKLLRSFSEYVHPTPLTYSRRYRGPLQAAILDWSGTTADNFVIAPAYAFVAVFEKFGVKITMDQARVPMGLRKDLHIKALTELPDIRELWKQVHKKYPGQKEVDDMFKLFVPLQLDCLRNYTNLIPGVKATCEALQKKYKLKLGTTTGFQRVMVDVLLQDANKQGFYPDCTVAGDEVSHPRPFPYMVFKNVEKLGVSPIEAVVKVDDTVGGVEEGLNAGCWSVGVSHTSNYMNINTMDEFKKMSKAEVEHRGSKAREILLKTGCHYVVNDLNALPPIIEDINRRLRSGERP